MYLENSLNSRFFNISKDRGLSEIIQYIKYIIVVFILFSYYKVEKLKILKAWIIFFIVLFLDDSIGLHEYIGKVVLPYIHAPKDFYLTTKNISELFGFAILEGIASLNILHKFLQANYNYKIWSIKLGLALLPLIFAGIVLDNLHFEFLEQLGEIIGATLLVVFELYVRPKTQ